MWRLPVLLLLSYMARERLSVCYVERDESFLPNTQNTRRVYPGYLILQSSVNSLLRSSVNSLLRSSVNSLLQSSVNSLLQSSVNSLLRSSVNSQRIFMYIKVSHKNLTRYNLSAASVYSHPALFWNCFSDALKNDSAAFLIRVILLLLPVDRCSSLTMVASRPIG